jgi:hypothetical protein
MSAEPSPRLHPYHFSFLSTIHMDIFFIRDKKRRDTGENKKKKGYRRFFFEGERRSVPWNCRQLEDHEPNRLANVRSRMLASDGAATLVPDTSDSLVPTPILLQRPHGPTHEWGPFGQLRFTCPHVSLSIRFSVRFLGFF